MASGRRDYTLGYLNETATGARKTTSFSYNSGGTCLVGNVKTILSYKVPKGYRLGINRIHVSTSSQSDNYFYVIAGPSTIANQYFSQNIELTYSDQNPYYLSAGYYVEVVVYNTDDIDAPFVSTLIGVLENIS